MADLNIDLDYFDHPKTTRLIGLLGLGSDALPLRLWCFLGKFHPKDGKLQGYSVKAIEQALKWGGKPGQAIEALIQVGYLEKAGKWYRAHDWASHQGHIYALKKRNKKVARNRWKNINKRKSTVDTSGIPKQIPGVPRPSLPSVPSKPTVQVVDSNVKSNDLESANELLGRVVEFSEDPKSTPFFVKALKTLGAGLVEEAMGEVRMRYAAGGVESKARYLTRVLSDWMTTRVPA